MYLIFNKIVARITRYYFSVISVILINSILSDENDIKKHFWNESVNFKFKEYLEIIIHLNLDTIKCDYF